MSDNTRGSEPTSPEPLTRMPPTAGFVFNRPTIVALCYLGTTVTGVSGLVGLVLAYVWRGESHAAWEGSHYTYLIRTFWIGLLGMAVATVLLLVILGWFLMVAIGVWAVVRCVLVLVNAQREQPMPDPETWSV